MAAATIDPLPCRGALDQENALGGSCRLGGPLGVERLGKGQSSPGQSLACAQCRVRGLQKPEKGGGAGGRSGANGELG